MRRTVLIIDDSATIRYLTRVYLTGLDLEFREAVNGRDGLAAVDVGGVDLVIADLQMPVVDGREFLKMLRASANPAHRALPVVIMTMERRPGLREELLAEGATQYLIKPVSNELLRRTVQELLPADP